MITAAQVKELREKTGAGIMDCKKALVECDGDVNKSMDWLREKGIAKAAKKASRIAAEGLCNAVISGNKAYVYELNSETDFVAKNEKFIALLNLVGETCVQNDAETAEAALASKTPNGNTLEEAITSATAIIGEKLSLRRVVCVNKNDDEVFGVYKHNLGKIVVVSVIKGTDASVAKDVCMHVAMYSPRYVNDTQVEKSVLDAEAEEIRKEMANDPEASKKPEAIREKMLMGRLSKFKKEICLVDQAFVKDSSVTVGQYLKTNSTSAVSFLRFEVGEGMEKRHDDFAAEVAAQAAQAHKA
jgi:elongation factor Ts